MTTYSCGFNAEELTQLNLKADVFFRGVEVSYTPQSSINDWETPGKLTTWNTKRDYEDEWSVDKSEVIVSTGDTVILSWYTIHKIIHLLKKDGINVIIIGENCVID